MLVSVEGFLAGGPAQLASSQDMDVDVIDRLAAVRAVIDYHPVAFGQPHLLSTLLCHDHHVTQ